eukprot:gene5075-5178_t
MRLTVGQALQVAFAVLVGILAGSYIHPRTVTHQRKGCPSALKVEDDPTAGLLPTAGVSGRPLDASARPPGRVLQDAGYLSDVMQKCASDYQPPVLVVANYVLEDPHSSDRKQAACQQGLLSAMRHGIRATVLGAGQKWKGLQEKPMLYYRALQRLRPSDPVLLADTDVVFLNNLSGLWRQYCDRVSRSNTTIVVSAEVGCLNCQWAWYHCNLKSTRQ